MKKRTYMVAVQVTINPTIYVEVVASSSKEAVQEAKGLVRLTKIIPDLIDECKTDLTDAQLKFIECGRAEKYHDASQCKLCSATK